MKKYVKKRILFAVLVIVWMIIIFYFSNENGDTSQGKSDIITNVIINVAIANINTPAVIYIDV